MMSVDARVKAPPVTHGLGWRTATLSCVLDKEGFAGRGRLPAGGEPSSPRAAQSKVRTLAT
jgi:hypothetical protein